ERPRRHAQACCVCCIAAGSPRALPSFPTRRSSDLAEREVEQGAGDVAAEDEPAGGEQLVEAAAHPVLGQAGLGGDLRGGGAAAQDRKSTRLNSSHVKISYAVFCLKKKTSQRAERDT